VIEAFAVTLRPRRRVEPIGTEAGSLTTRYTMSLGRNISATFLTRLIIIALGVIASIVTARALGPTGKGILATLTSLAGVALVLET